MLVVDYVFNNSWDNNAKRDSVYSRINGNMLYY